MKGFKVIGNDKSKDVNIGVTIKGLDDGGGGDGEGGGKYHFVHYLFYYNKVFGLESIMFLHFVEKSVKLRGKR